jgi:hypothetical protein
LVHLRYVTKRPRTGEGCDPGNSGVWERDYGWGVRVRRHFGARGMSSVRYRTRLGDLKNKQSTERGWGVRVRRHFGARGMSSVRYRTRLGDLKNKQINRLEKTPRRVPCPMVGHLKHSFFGLSQPKSKRFTPPWGPEIFACGNLNEHIRICAAERPSLFLASAHCPSGRRQCRCPGKPVRECAVPRAL